MQVHRKSLFVIRFSFDIILLILSFFLTLYSLIYPNIRWINTSEQLLLISLITIWIFYTKITGLYDEFRSRNFSYELGVIFKNVLIQSVTVIVILFFTKEKYLSRSFVMLYSSYLLGFISLEKFLIRRVLNSFRKRGRNLRNLLIIGAGDVGMNFFKVVKKNPHFGYKLLGFLDDERKPYLNGEYLGSIDKLDNILTNKKVDDVIIALPNYAVDRIETVVSTCEEHTTRIKIIPDYFRYSSSKYSVSMFGQFPVVSLREDRLNELHWRLIKRVFDLSFTIILFIIIFSWLWPIIWILQKLFNSGPVLYKSARWGRNGKVFNCYKFRSMIPESNNVDESGNHNCTTKDDPRITKFGKFLRRTNLDELPQFFNVLKGDMSIVGPRPHDVDENLEIKDKIKRYMWRYIGKPGITGWAQVNGYRGGTKSTSLMQKRINYDIWYIENWSFWLDIQIVFLTVWRMIKGDPNAY